MVLTIDIGGTEVKYAVFKPGFEAVHYATKQPTILKDQAKFLSALQSNIERVANRFALDGIAISSPGLIQQGFVKNGGSIRALDQLDLGAYLQKRYRVLVSVNNDAQCALKAEASCGALCQFDDGVVITLGTGVGGGILLNGHPLASATHPMAGEFSYMLHSFTAVNTFSRVGKRLAATTMVQDINQHGTTTANAFDGVAALRQVALGVDQYASQRFNAYCAAVASLIINLQAVLDVPRFVIGGGITADPQVLPAIRAAFDQIVAADVMYQTFHRPEIVATHFKNYSGRVGAQLFWQESKEG